MLKKPFKTHNYDNMGLSFMADIEQYISDVRDIINRPRKQSLLLKEKKVWNQLTSSMDVIQDTDIAIDSYLENEFPKDYGEKYIWIYGVLQNLFVQQDAVKNLIESLDLNPSVEKPLEKIRDIRDIRNKATGHPTKKGWGKSKFTFHFISRSTINRNGFQLMSCMENDQIKFSNIYITEHIKKQRGIIIKILGNIMKELNKEETAHKKKFTNEKLADIFPKTLHNIISKLFEAVYSKTHPKPFGILQIKIIEETLEEFKQALIKRDLWNVYDTIDHLYYDISFPICELEKYFNMKRYSKPAYRRAYIYMFFIQKKLDELKELAMGIDEDYGIEENNIIQYKGNVWAKKYEEIKPSLLKLLKAKDKLIILRHAKPPYKVVLGVPHQSAIGESHICKNGKKRDSDENAASYALVAFTNLKDQNIPSKLVIMAHSTTKDPNKEEDSLYWKEIFKDNGELLFECHGSSGKRENELELSAGKNKESDAIKFGRLLGESLNYKYKLGIQKEAGKKGALIINEYGKEKPGELQLSANNTKSLIEASNRKIPALHLEAKPNFRIPKDKSDTVTSDALNLGKAISETIIKLET